MASVKQTAPMGSTPVNIEKLMAQGSASRSIADTTLNNNIILPQNLLQRVLDEYRRKHPTPDYSRGIDPPEVFGAMIYTLKMKERQESPVQQPAKDYDEPHESGPPYPTDIR